MHWKDSKELHRVIHSLSGALRAVLLELMDGHMSRHEIRDFLNRMGRGRHSRGIGTAQLNLEQDLRKPIEVKVLEERDGRYLLTPGGREISGHIRRALDMASGRVGGEQGAAKLLKINPSTLRKRMRKLGIPFGRNVEKRQGGQGS